MKVNPKLSDLLVPVKGLKLDKKNTRKHNDRSIASIAKSLETYGQQKPIVVLKNGTVIAGNGQLAAAKSLNWKQIAAVTFEDEAKARAFAIADNRTAELSEWDNDELAETIQQLAAEDEALTLDMLGFEDAEVAKLLADVEAAKAAETVEEDEIGEVEDGEDDEVAPMGAPSNEAPAEAAGAPPSHVRMVQLFLNQDNHPTFVAQLRDLAKHHGTTTTTDTILAVVAKAHASLGAAS